MRWASNEQPPSSTSLTEGMHYAMSEHATSSRASSLDVVVTISPLPEEVRGMAMLDDSVDNDLSASKSSTDGESATLSALPDPRIHNITRTSHHRHVFVCVHDLTLTDVLQVRAPSWVMRLCLPLSRACLVCHHCVRLPESSARWSTSRP